MKNKIKDLFNLEKKTIIIAGGAGQIGFSMCEAILSYGARVIVVDLDIENFLTLSLSLICICT